MQMSEARNYIGRLCSIRWKTRNGLEQVVVSKVYDVTFVPLYGAYLVTDTDDIRLDRISEVALIEEGSAEPQLMELERLAA